jgi:hypothetical protein
MQVEKLYMPFLNWAKVGAIWLADTINLCWNPFYEQLAAPSTQNLGALETLFSADLEARFMRPTGQFDYQLPPAADSGDTALFQGLCTAYKIMKGDNVDTQVAFIQTLFANGVLLRGYYQNGIANDTTSNDSATGMVMFFYAALRWGTPTVRTRAGALLRLWINSLVAHNGALVDLQGNATQYGALDNGWLTDPLRITDYLAVLALGMAYDATNNVAHTEYARLYNLYRPILPYAKVRLLWWNTDYDTHRAGIHLHVLYNLTGDSVYKRGLQRLMRITRKENNAWVYVLCRDALDTKNDASVVRILGTFDFQRRQLGDVQSLNDGQPSVNWPPKFPSWLSFLGTTQKRCRYALPFNRRGSQDFFWQRCMFSLDEWTGNTKADVYHSGLDILICGWMASRLGII